jgi:murein DD-endopeptidase MepM/ murein hydrolase activator NlpD
LKRAFPQKVKPVSYHQIETDATVGQSKQATSGVNRRARTSAAMIGLALSMGASSLLLPRQDDGAAAAEPQPTESTLAAGPLATQAASSPSGMSVEADATASISLPDTSTVDHVVQQGQTLWQIAHRYHVNVEVLATTNGLTVASVLQVGQTLKIPTTVSEPDSSTAAQQPAAPTELQVAEVPDAEVQSSSPVDVDSQLKAEQDEALNLLRQNREKLRSSLAELQSEQSQSSTPDAPKVQIVPSQEEVKAPEQSASLSEETIATSAASDEPAQTTALTAASSSMTHQVKPGDTLDAIARIYQVSPQEVAAVNHLSNPDWLQVNQALVIPQVSPVVHAPTAAMVPSADAPTSLPTVVASATSQNSASSSQSVEAASTGYQVSPGDTIGEIAQRYNVPEMALAEANHLTNPNLIVVNQVLTIPSVEAAVPTELSSAPVADPPSLPVSVAPATTMPEQFAPEAAPDGSATPANSQISTTIMVPTVPMANGLPAANEIAVVPPSPETEAQLSQNAESIATAPTGVTPAHNRGSSQPLTDTTIGSNPYVDNLMAEILSLRDRYQQEAASTQAAALPQPTAQAEVVAAAPVNEPVALVGRPESANARNPEFNSDHYIQGLQAEVRRLQQEQQAAQSQPTSPVVAAAPTATPVVPATPSPQAASSSTESQRQLVAVAPLGSESYEPLLQPITGRTVSPDLPPLPGAEAYLPEGAPTFNGYLWPTRGTLTSGYGWRWGRMHRGIDIGAPTGTPVVAAAAGEVVFSGWNSGGYGNMVDIRHADGSVTRYAHNSRLLVRVGQQVDQGQTISEVGSTGYSTGPHLHFEVHLPSQGTVNPIAYLPASR